MSEPTIWPKCRKETVTVGGCCTQCGAVKEPHRVAAVGQRLRGGGGIAAVGYVGGLALSSLPVAGWLLFGWIGLAAGAALAIVGMLLVPD
jgi:hypothetical protein